MPNPGSGANPSGNRGSGDLAAPHFAVKDYGHFSPQSQAGAAEAVSAIADLHAVEWNPTGDEWVPADVVERRGERAVIKLRDNGQTLTVEWRHCRAALRGGQQ